MDFLRVQIYAFDAKVIPKSKYGFECEEKSRALTAKAGKTWQ